MQVMKEEKVRMVEDFINAFADKHNVSPSNRQITDGTGLPLSTVSRYLHYMRDNGILDYAGCRNITTSRQKKVRVKTNFTPLLGQIACGEPIFADGNVEEYVPLPVSLFGESDFFLLHTKGDSMINAGIADGDLVLIRQTNTAEPGQIVVALIDDEATLKRYYPDPKNNRIVLHPENDNLKDMYYDDVMIQGVALKVLKDGNQIMRNPRQPVTDYHHFANVGKIVDHFRGIKNMVYEGVNMNDKIQLFENQKIRTA